MNMQIPTRKLKKIVPFTLLQFKMKAVVNSGHLILKKIREQQSEVDENYNSKIL